MSLVQCKPVGNRDVPLGLGCSPSLICLSACQSSLSPGALVCPSVREEVLQCQLSDVGGGEEEVLWFLPASYGKELSSRTPGNPQMKRLWTFKGQLEAMECKLSSRYNEQI